MLSDRRMLFIDELVRDPSKANHQERLSTRCYGAQCEAKGCSGHTVGSKPYCLDHIHLMPYVVKIRERETARCHEVELTSGPPLNGYVARDLLGAVRLNYASIPALARDLRIPLDVIEELVLRLSTAQLLTIRRTKRGLYVKQFTPPDNLVIPESLVQPVERLVQTTPLDTCSCLSEDESDVLWFHILHRKR